MTDLENLAADKVSQLQKELQALGLVTSLFWRAPGSAKAPVLYLLVGETASDIEEARADKRS